MKEPGMECGIALGSNSGDRLAHLQAAVTVLRGRDPALEVSPIYESAPVDCPAGSPAFYNAVAILHWRETPESLLAFLRDTEARLGRPAVRTRNAQRNIDLDILYAGDAVRHSDSLTIPHPRMHLRRFVLQPLCDLRPVLILPGTDKTAAMLLAALPSGPPAVSRLDCAL